MPLNSLWRSPPLRAAAVFGLAGVGFAGANILLARFLSSTEYATASLVVALIITSITFGPVGAEGVVNRRRIDPGPKLLRRVLFTSALVALVTVVLAGFVYRLGTALLLVLLLSITAGGANRLASAVYQSRREFGRSLMLNVSQNFVLLGAALALPITGIRQAWLACAIYAFGFVESANRAWRRLFRQGRPSAQSGEDFSWFEALSLLSVSAAGMVLLQLERLLLPKLLSLNDLATYGVLASTAGAPFRMLQQGVGYTLLPQLRAATDVHDRRKLILREGILVAAVMVSAGGVVWVLTPPVVRWFLAGKYTISRELVLASLIAGAAKVVTSLASSAATALSTSRELARLGAGGWLAIAVAAGVATFGARWGLTGVIYGVAVGWLGQAALGVTLMIRHLRDPAEPR